MTPWSPEIGSREVCWRIWNITRLFAPHRRLDDKSESILGLKLWADLCLCFCTICHSGCVPWFFLWRLAQQAAILVSFCNIGSAVQFWRRCGDFWLGWYQLIPSLYHNFCAWSPFACHKLGSSFGAAHVYHRKALLDPAHNSMNVALDNINLNTDNLP